MIKAEEADANSSQYFCMKFVRALCEENLSIAQLLMPIIVGYELFHYLQCSLRIPLQHLQPKNANLW